MEFASCRRLTRNGSHRFHGVKGSSFFLAIFLQGSKWSEEAEKRGEATNVFVDMSSIPDPYEECWTVLIEGEPGMGKPNFCKKYAYDWATKKRVAWGCGSSAFKAVLLPKCRDMHSDVWSTSAPPRHRWRSQTKILLVFSRKSAQHFIAIGWIGWVTIQLIGDFFPNLLKKEYTPDATDLQQQV